MEFQLREFRREDFDILWRIDQECFPPGIAYSRVELADYMRHAAITLVAESIEGSKQASPAESADGNGNVLGFILVETGKRRTGHVITIDVVAKARRFGVGSRLLIAAEDGLRTLKCAAVTLETAVDNLAALAFYQRHKYHVVKTAPHYYSTGLDAFVLRKDLLSSVDAS